MISLKSIKYIAIFFLMSFVACSIQKNTLNDESIIKDPHTTKTFREEFKKNLYNNEIAKNLSLALSEKTESNWMDAFDAMEVSLDADEAYKSNMKSAFAQFEKRSLSFQRYLLETVFTLYPNDFYNEVLDVTQKTENPKLFAMGINYLKQDQNNKYNNDYYLELLNKKFSDWKDNPILFSLGTYLTKSPEVFSKERPSLTDLFSYNFERKCTIIFSLQRNDRDYKGIAIIRKPDGKFLRKADGTIFNIPQLARSITNLPTYLTNGNTPQGIFSMQGIDTSKKIFIGRTPNIQLIMPFETSPSVFFHDKINNNIWGNNLYKNLLPESWRKYFPIWGTFYAGKAGRTEIISHGTTIDPSFYFGKTYYPSTPTVGCLCANEIWSDHGTRAVSDQEALIEALKSTGDVNGYIVVVELDNKKQPVVIDEVTMDILKAENILSKVEK
ncbi:MAG: hypothetical protein M1480_19690 [Bacteroidetes bacterium]|nr:hypothetical protein [Bacteroidota bacterium]